MLALSQYCKGAALYKSNITRAKLNTYLSNTYADLTCYTPHFAAISPPVINRLKSWVTLKKNSRLRCFLLFNVILLRYDRHNDNALNCRLYASVIRRNKRMILARINRELALDYLNMARNNDAMHDHNLG